MSESQNELKTPPESIAVIGAGMAGLTCATALMLNVPELKVFEKTLHAGGRMATHRDKGFEFDCGVQFFTAQGDAFQGSLDGWLQERVVAPWRAWVVELDRGDFMSRNDYERYVGVPTMSALGRHLSDLCEVQLAHEIKSVTRTDAGLAVCDVTGERLGVFDRVLCATTPDVAQRLLSSVAPQLCERIASVEMTRCWVLMLGFDEPVSTAFDAAYVSNSPLSWVARNNSKPGRAQREGWVLHATPEWTEAHAEDRPADVINALLSAFDQALGGLHERPKVKSVRFWHQAAAIDSLGTASLYDPQSGVGVCGDWCVGPRLEGAFTSGLALANQVLEQL